MMNYQSIYDIPVEKMDGSLATLEDYKGRVLLIVNVASRCGFTPQYKQLETLYHDLHDKGLDILAFPCDQFLHQEPGSNEEIQQFAESCYRVTFPIFSKITVKGKDRSPLYTYIKNNLQKRPLKFIPWNFTKILVDQKGNILRQFSPIISFTKVERDIRHLLNQ